MELAIWYPYRISIGKCTINELVWISGYGGFQKLEMECVLDNRISIMSSDHKIGTRDELFINTGIIAKPTKIEDDVFTGGR